MKQVGHSLTSGGCFTEFPNNQLEFALARPTHKSEALLRSAQPER
jgi:hypothetical protein